MGIFLLFTCSDIKTLFFPLSLAFLLLAVTLRGPFQTNHPVPCVLLRQLHCVCVCVRTGDLGVWAENKRAFGGVKARSVSMLVWSLALLPFYLNTVTPEACCGRTALKILRKTHSWHNRNSNKNKKSTSRKRHLLLKPHCADEIGSVS